MHPEFKLSEQVSGIFENGTGLFYGQDLHNGNPVKVRFLWKKETPNTAQWEQAFYDETKEEWETNWVMEFTQAPT